MKLIDSIWVILDQHDNFCAFGTKAAWISSGAARNAFSCHQGNKKLDDCPEYKLVEIKQ